MSNEKGKYLYDTIASKRRPGPALSETPKDHCEYTPHWAVNDPRDSN